MDLNTDTVRPFKAQKIKEYKDRYAVSGSEMETARACDAVILPVRLQDDPEFDCGVGGVLYSDGSHVPEGDSEELVGRGYDIPGLPVLEQKRVVYCGYFQLQWGHFLMQSCNRLWYALRNPDDVDEYVFAIGEGAEVPDLGGTNHEEMFRLLGIAGKVRLINVPHRYEEVIMPQESFAITRYVRSGFARLFDELRKRATDQASRSVAPRRRVLLGRSSFAKAGKMELGLQGIESHFRRNGYEVVYPERTSLARLISIMAGADEIVAFSGTVAHNIIFAPPHAQVTVIERYPYVNYFQTAIDLAFDLDTTYVDANAFIQPVNVGLGPFIYCANRYFKAYCEKRGLTVMAAPTEKECRAATRRFVRLYEREYGHGHEWEMPAYLEDLIPGMKDALEESAPMFGKERHCPRWFMLSVRFSPYLLARSVYRSVRRALSGRL